MSMLALTGCSAAGTVSADTGQSGQKTPVTPSDKAVQKLDTKPATPVSAAAVTPADGATGVLTSTDISVTTSGTVQSVAVTGTDGKAVTGAPTPDGKGWRPAAQLAYAARYTINAIVKSGALTSGVMTTFTTMAKPSPGKLTGADLYFADGDTVGVGMPLVVEFTRNIPVAQRAAIERRLFVKTAPAVEGSWSWRSAGEVHYRPKAYWKSGTKITLRAAIGGMPMGGGRFGKRDRVATITVGSAVISKVNNATKTMAVYQDGKLLRTMPVSLGKRSSPTSAGTHVVMEKKPEAWFDSSTFGLPVDAPGGYRKKVYWDVRYTWGGEFAHAAPWSLGDQGKRNVSNGCINLSPANARWYYDLSKKGDIVEVVGTERKVKPGDGWDDWTIPWETYKAGSALS